MPQTGTSSSIRLGSRQAAGATVVLTVPDELIELVAQRAAAIAAAEQAPAAACSPFLTIPEAAVFARCKRQRIDDLLSAQKLRRYKEGRRTLVLRAELETYLGLRESPTPVSSQDSTSAAVRATVTDPGNRDEQ